MSYARPALAFALAALSLAACATGTAAAGYRVDADVHSLPDGKHDAIAMTKTAGATVAIDCPGEARRVLGLTDAAGALHAEGAGVIPLTCKLTVDEPGARTVRYSVEDLCTEQNSDGCRELAVRAVLVTAAGSGGDAP